MWTEGREPRRRHELRRPLARARVALQRGKGFLEDQVDPLEMRWDRSARKKNLKDARRIWRVKTMGIDEAQAGFTAIHLRVFG